MDDLYIKLYIFIVIIFSAVLHEYAHGWMAYRLGDDTAKQAGRLTINPIAHIDPIGTLLLPLTLLFTTGVFIGWAKPVPYNPYQLSDKRRGNLKVAVAGPITNIIIAIALGILVRFAPMAGLNPVFVEFCSLAVYVNIFLALFNLIPIPPLDGSKIIMDLFPQVFRNIAGIGIVGILLALMAAMYILPPIARVVFTAITGM